MSEEISVAEQSSKPITDDAQLNFMSQTTSAEDDTSQMDADSYTESPEPHNVLDEKGDIDAKSVYVGNVDYGATPEELQQQFAAVGNVNRVTILMNRLTGQPKGFAYIEFVDAESVNKAIEELDGSHFRERELKVSAKRTNIPGISTTNRGGHRGRGRGPRGRGRGRGFRGFRGSVRARGRFNPY